MIYISKKCPICGSTDLTVERMPGGKTKCNDCEYYGNHPEFIVVNIWNKSYKKEFGLRISNQEEMKKETKNTIKNITALGNMYKRLAIIRNDQLKNVPFSMRGDNINLDIAICKKIEKLRIIMGLPEDA